VASITIEIEHLFFAQNEMLTPEKKNYLLAEISGTGYPVQSIIAALKKLQHETIKHVKLGEILATIREHYAPAEIKENIVEFVSAEERQYNGLYISKLRSIYGKDWFKHFNYPNYDTPMSGLDALKRIAIERWGKGWETGLVEAKNPLNDLTKSDPIVGDQDAIDTENQRKDIYG
jgi:hypothetical protein